MRFLPCSTALLLAVVLTTNIRSSDALLGDLTWSSLVPALREQIKNLWQNHELEFLGYPCFYFQKPMFKRWKLSFQGSFICPTWTNVRGTARTSSQSGVLTATIEDFLKRVSQRNLVTPEEAQAWLSGFQ